MIKYLGAFLCQTYSPTIVGPLRQINKKSFCFKDLVEILFSICDLFLVSLLRPRCIL